MKFVNNGNVVCIDFNGVLDTYVGWQGEDYMYPMREGTVEFLQALKDMGYRLVILTAMNTYKVKKWLKDNKIDHLIEDVTNIKIPAILYIDDRGLTFKGDFRQTLEDVKNFRVFWKGNTKT